DSDGSNSDGSDSDAFSAAPGREDALCSILYTSGSSGAPRAVAHRWRQHRAAAAASQENLPLDEWDCWQCVIPLHHIGGLAILTRALFYGCAVLLHDGFDVAEVTAALHGRDVTVSSLVPTMLHRMLEADENLRGDDLPLLRAILLGGAGAAEALWLRIMDRNLPVVGTYGLTESCAQVATADPDRWRAEAWTAGRALPGVDLVLRDAEGRRCAAGGKAGEIHLRGAMIAEGYYHDSTATDAAFSKGWFATGDIGALDNDGNLHVLARRVDMILSGGEKVFPSVVEELLLRHEGVIDAAVVGVEDEEWGQRVAAALVLRPGAKISDVEEFCREELAAHQLPRLWRVLDALPRTANGKILRGKLREMFRD
ncbi:MAG: AMP-binding protein, partial [Bacteroidota bacterium]|nr:AMP-binding protein [Bacteroidota bacterium]